MQHLSPCKMLLTSLSKHSVQISRGKVTWMWGVETSKIKAKARKTQYNDKTNNQHLICMFILQVIICIYLSLQEIKQTFV